MYKYPDINDYCRWLELEGSANDSDNEFDRGEDEDFYVDLYKDLHEDEDLDG